MNRKHDIIWKYKIGIFDKKHYDLHKIYRKFVSSTPANDSLGRFLENTFFYSMAQPVKDQNVFANRSSRQRLNYGFSIASKSINSTIKWR